MGEMNETIIYLAELSSQFYSKDAVVSASQKRR